MKIYTIVLHLVLWVSSNIRYAQYLSLSTDQVINILMNKVAICDLLRCHSISKCEDEILFFPWWFNFHIIQTRNFLGYLLKLNHLQMMAESYTSILEENRYTLVSKVDPEPFLDFLRQLHILSEEDCQIVQNYYHNKTRRERMRKLMFNRLDGAIVGCMSPSI